MSEIRVDNIIGEDGQSAPSFTSGFSASGVNVTGVITATSFSGDGTNLSNTGSTLSAGSGSQRVVLTGQTSGTMTSSATNSGLTFNSSTGALSATSYSGSGANLTGVLKTDISNLPTLP